jgi:serine/threonine protein kinase/Tfp pilus assembly protein PilF
MNDQPTRDIAVFTEAVGLPPGERGAYLDSACAGDLALRGRVEVLLEAHGKAGDFLDVPARGEGAGAAPEQPGDRIGHYKLLEQIGEGGCGVVFMAEQLEPVRRLVALKVIKPGMDSKSVIARFEAERQALALMDHPGIAKVFDAGTTESGRPFFVMELVRGVKITDYCDQHSLTTGARLELFVQVCHAVQHAHQKGIIHRDLKPSNILVTTTEEGTPLPKVIDFGIAKATTGQRLTDKTLFTAFELLIGTPAYMSPEQAELTSVDVDTRSDVYSLGVLLYELLTGTTPFDTQELLKAGLDEVRRVIRSEEPVRPSARLSTMLAADLTTVSQHRRAEPPKLIRELRGDLDWIVMKALEKDRTRRYPTANGLAADIEHFRASEGISARPPSTLYRLRKLAARNKLLFAGISGIVLSLIAGLSVAMWLLEKERRAHRDADIARAQAEVDKRQAQTEADKSRQVTRFFEEMLNSVGPSVAMGRDATILREVLDRTAQRIKADLKAQPEVEAELRYAMGIVYQDIGAHEQSVDMLGRSLELRRGFLPADSPVVADTSSRLATALLYRAKADEAEIHARAALAIWQARGESDTLGTCGSKETLGMVLWKKDELEPAEALMREALALRRQFQDPGHEDAIITLNNLGNVIFTAKRFAEAEKIYREALELWKKRFGPEHPSVALALNNLASACVDQGKSTEAAEYFSQAVAMRRKLLGENHPSYAASLDSLADVHRLTGNHADAETLYRKALDLERKQLGSGHPDVRRTLNNLVTVLIAQNKSAEIEALFHDLLTPEFVRDPGSVPLLVERAESLARRGRWKDAAADAAQALAHEPDDHQRYHMLAPLLVAGGDMETYRDLCGRIAARFAGTTNCFVADRMAKDCLIVPLSGFDPAAVSTLADKAVTLGHKEAALPFFQTCKALAEYRTGKFQNAVDWAERALKSSFRHAQAEAGAVQAMALFKLEQHEAARAALARCADIVERKLPPPGSSDIGADWRDWIICRTLLNEARALLGVTIPENPKPSDQ